MSTEMTNPLVSVFMPMFNEERYIRTAVESILEQTHQNLELIIIDDYSTDRSLEICASIGDPNPPPFQDRRAPLHGHLSKYRHPDGPGEYVINQDADDWAHPRRIECQLAKALENPGRRVVGCSVIRAEHGVERIFTFPETHAEICNGFTRLADRNTFFPGTILAPRSVLLDIPYRVRFKYMHDWDLNLQLFESGRVEFYNCRQPLYKYYIRQKGVVFRPEWFYYNIFVRQSQQRRNKGLEGNYSDPP